ncbi:MAG: chain-length determining protein [Duncaniella sp.]|uniref:Wzz/FepE/Etk N-terminal domain-containing protein n=1 Tax=Duncaniella sp. TaxID=2518496 RepID=UPI0023BB5886|nr:Wzz/FepE/Etk N-terminal domain-containing protein [Duncaniella sp.]MDE6090765.1 chain-length determining protein [Duncaniella sp.]
MSNEQDVIVRNNNNDEEEIDLLEIASKLWKSRRTIFIYCGIGAILGLIVAFSIPKEYTTTIKLAPELNGSSSGASKLGSLASMAGINLGSANAGGDAVMPQLYPDVLSSTPFLVGLFDVPVTESKTDATYPLYTYIEDHTSGTWWGYLFGLPFKAIGGVMSLIRGNDDEEGVGDGELNPFRLTKDQEEIKNALAKRIVCSYDQKTGVNTISVTMQNPLVSALVADTVAAHLQAFITEYRTSKARQDLAYAEQLNEEARKEYYDAQQRLADYLDRNQNLSYYSAQVTRDRLTNESNLAFSLFNQTAQQLQMAKAKVQETTPVYATVEPATVPIKASKPSKVMVLFGFIFLGGVIASAKIIFADKITELKQSFSK